MGVYFLGSRHIDRGMRLLFLEKILVGGMSHKVNRLIMV